MAMGGYIWFFSRARFASARWIMRSSLSTTPISGLPPISKVPTLNGSALVVGRLDRAWETFMDMIKDTRNKRNDDFTMRLRSVE